MNPVQKGHTWAIFFATQLSGGTIMKKIIIALLILGTICVNTFAQEYDVVEVGEEVDFNHSEVYATAGIPSFLGLFLGMFSALGEGIAKSLGQNNNSGEEQQKKESVFSLAAGYNYYFTENFGVGGIVTYENFSGLSLMTAQAKVIGQYGWEHFKFYHSASAGIMFSPQGDKPNFIFDVTYLGLKLDFENWNVFVDASIPATGIIKVGASYKF